jgi:hypothetical protein
MERAELLPGVVLDKVYPYIMFPHDQISTLILGMEGHGFKDAGPISMLHCGDVGGDQSWKQGLPSWKSNVFGEVPVFPKGVGVIHPIRSKKFEEGRVRAFFRTMRSESQPATLEQIWDIAGWNYKRLPTVSWD